MVRPRRSLAKMKGVGGQLSRDANEVFAVYLMCRLLSKGGCK